MLMLPGGRPLWNPPLAQGPVPSSRDLGRAARGGDPLGPPRWLKAPFLRHETLAVLPGGATRLEPPAGSRPRSFVTRPWPCCPGGDPLGTPRWLKAPFLRHETLAVLPGGRPAWNPPLAQGPVPSSRDLGRAARGGDPLGTPRWLEAPFLRHETLAVLPGGATPRNPPLARGRAALGPAPETPSWPGVVRC